MSPLGTCMLVLPLDASGRNETEPTGSGLPSSVTLPTTGTNPSASFLPQPHPAQSKTVAPNVGNHRRNRVPFPCLEPVLLCEPRFRVPRIMVLLNGKQGLTS